MSQSEKGSSEKGVVKWFNDAKGFGFIEHSSGKDVFVHYSVIISDGFKTLKDGEAVEYEMIEGDKGLHAVKVRRTDAAIAASAQALATAALVAGAAAAAGAAAGSLATGVEVARSDATIDENSVGDVIEIPGVPSIDEHTFN